VNFLVCKKECKDTDFLADFLEITANIYQKMPNIAD